MLDYESVLEKFSNPVLGKTLGITKKEDCKPGYKYYKNNEEITYADYIREGGGMGDDDEEDEVGYKLTTKVDKGSFSYGAYNYKISQNDNAITIADKVNSKYLTKKDNDRYEFYFLDKRGKKDRIELVLNAKGDIDKRNYYLDGEKMDCVVDFNDGAQLSNIDNYTLTCPDETTIKIKATANHKVEKIERNGKEISDNRPLKVILNEAKIATSKNQSRDLVKKKNYIFRNINAKTENSKPSYFKYNGIEYMNR